MVRVYETRKSLQYWVRLISLFLFQCNSICLTCILAPYRYATKEYKKKYAKRKPRIGQTVWLLTITIGLETAAVFKYSLALRLFSNATKFDVRFWGPWLSSITIFLSYWLIHCSFFYRGARQYPTWLKVWKWTSFLPLLLLGRLYAF